jgi:hypothetical protein
MFLGTSVASPVVAGAVTLLYSGVLHRCVLVELCQVEEEANYVLFMEQRELESGQGMSSSSILLVKKGGWFMEDHVFLQISLILRSLFTE